MRIRHDFGTGPFRCIAAGHIRGYVLSVIRLDFDDATVRTASPVAIEVRSIRLNAHPDIRKRHRGGDTEAEGDTYERGSDFLSHDGPKGQQFQCLFTVMGQVVP